MILGVRRSVGLVAFPLVASLTACGGGGGSTTTQQPGGNGQVNIQTGLATVASKGSSGTCKLSGWYLSASASVTGSANAQESVASQTTIAGTSVLAQTLALAGTATAGGTTIPILASPTYYSAPSNYAPVAANAGSYFIVYGTASMPTNIAAGDSGVIATGKIYTDSSMTTQIGTVNYSYGVAADTSTSLNVSFAATQYNSNGQQTVTNTLSYRMGTDGSASLTAIGLDNTGAANSTANLTPYSLVCTIQ